MSGVDPDPTGLRARTRKAMGAAGRPGPPRAPELEEVLAVSFTWSVPGHVDQVEVLQAVRRLRLRAGAGGSPHVQPGKRRLGFLDRLVDAARTGGVVKVSVKDLDRTDRELLAGVLSVGWRSADDGVAGEVLRELSGEWETFVWPQGRPGDNERGERARARAREAAQWTSSELIR